jgi:hypothetical protein
LVVNCEPFLRTQSLNGLTLPHSITLKPFPMLSNLDNEAHWQQAAVWRQNVCWIKRFHAEGQTVEEWAALMQLSAEAVQDRIDLNADHYRKPFF